MKSIFKKRMYDSFKDEEQCKVAMEGLVKDSYAETGTNSHFWCRSKDGKALFVLEQS